MPDQSPNRVAVYVLGAALGACLLVIGFLLGRESTRAPGAPDPAEAPLAATPAPIEPATELAQGEERRWPEWADLDELEPGQADAQLTETYAGRIERHPDGRIVLSNRNLDGTAHSPNTTPRPEAEPTLTPATAASTTPSNEGAVVAYFQRIDEIRSDQSTDDPNAFAMDLIKATMRGSTEGFDELIADAELMRVAMEELEPPPECQVYHRESLAALGQSRTLLEAMRDAITSGNIGALGVINQRASVLQAKADTLDTLRQQILANALR